MSQLFRLKYIELLLAQRAVSQPSSQPAHLQHILSKQALVVYQGGGKRKRYLLPERPCKTLCSIRFLMPANSLPIPPPTSPPCCARTLTIAPFRCHLPSPSTHLAPVLRRDLHTRSLPLPPPQPFNPPCPRAAPRPAYSQLSSASPPHSPPPRGRTRAAGTRTAGSAPAPLRAPPQRTVPLRRTAPLSECHAGAQTWPPADVSSASRPRP